MSLIFFYDGMASALILSSHSFIHSFIVKFTFIWKQNRTEGVFGRINSFTNPNALYSIFVFMSGMKIFSPFFSWCAQEEKMCVEPHFYLFIGMECHKPSSRYFRYIFLNTLILAGKWNLDDYGSVVWDAVFMVVGSLEGGIEGLEHNVDVSANVANVRYMYGQQIG